MSPHRQRHRPIFPRQTPIGDFLKMSLPIVQKQSCSTPDRIDEQIEIAVPVHVRQHCPGGELSRATDTGLIGDVLKPPIAPVPIQAVAVFQTAEIQITPAVSVHIPGGHSRPVHPDLVGGGGRIAEMVGKGYARHASGKTSKANPTRFWQL